MNKCYNATMAIATQNRTRSGQFLPGKSGNPGGRPKDERVRGTAAQALLDRGWGKAKVEVVTGAEGSYLDVLRVVNKSMLAKRNETQT